MIDHKFALSFAGYSLTHLLGARYLLKYIPNADRLSDKDRAYLVEKLPSSISAILVSATSAYSLFFTNSFTKKRIYSYPALLDTVFACHGGYSLYDLLVMAKSGSQLSVYIHHIFGIMGTICTRHFREGCVFPGIFCLTESTVLVTNSIWILERIFPHKTDCLNRLYIFRALVFVCIRGAMPIWLWLYLKRMYGGGKEWIEKFKSDFKQMKKIVQVLICLNTGIFCALNTYWSLQTIRAVYRRRSTEIHHI